MDPAQPSESLARGLDASPDRSPDTSANTRPDGAPGSPDGARSVSPDVWPGGPDGAAGPCQTPPTLSCVRGPRAATVLLEQADLSNVMGLASSGEEIFIASGLSYDISRRGRVIGVSLRTREARTFEHKGYPANLRYQAQSLIASPSFYNPSTTGSYLPDILRWDLRTGDMTKPPQPAGVDSPSVQALTANARGEIIWSLTNGTIAKWDPCANRTEVLTDGRDALFLFADQSHIYWQEPKRGRRAVSEQGALLYSMPPTAGASASLLADVPVPTWNGRVLFAIDEQNLYFLEPARGIWAMPKTGGDRRLVIPSGHPLWLDSSTLDDTDIYYVDSSDQSTLRRASKQGGPIQLWRSDADRPIQALTVDACNVYWFAANPPTLYYRAK